jgi:hypothetical protein
MIKLFRNIRQTLIMENKTSKYLKYAIGEIVLVVLGILIALQVNNWNEQRKTRLEEIKILKDFQENLHITIENLNKAMATNIKAKNSMNFLLDYMERDLPYKDSLKYNFGNTNFQWLYTISTSVFDALKSKGLNLISNDSLRQHIVDTYSWANGGFQDDQKSYRDILIYASRHIYNTRFDQFWYDNYETWKNRNSFEKKNYTINDIVSQMVPIDFEKLKKDKEYIYFLKSLRNQYNWLIESQNKGMTRSLDELENEIGTELTRLENQ